MPTTSRVLREFATTRAIRSGHLLGAFKTATRDQLEAGVGVRGQSQATCRCGLVLTLRQGTVTETGPSRFTPCPGPRPSPPRLQLG